MSCRLSNKLTVAMTVQGDKNLKSEAVKTCESSIESPGAVHELFDFMPALLKVYTCTLFLQCNDDVCTR